MHRILIAILIVFVLHCNDVKISVIKISEILMLLYGFINAKRFHKTSKVFFLFFTGWLFVSLIHNLFLKFDTSVVTSILQQPYLCSVGRYFELLACLSFVELIINFCNEKGFKDSIESVFLINFWFCILLLMLYVLELIGVFTAFNVITQSGRLCGFFNEGGPFGLLIAMLLILSLMYKRGLVEKTVLVLCMTLSVSKAGVMLLLVYTIAYYFRKAKHNRRLKRRIILLSLPLLFLFVYTSYLLVKTYGLSWIDSEATMKYAVSNPNDMNFVAGRVAGKYILFEMVTKNPLIGIGLGNYPIMRNLDEYRLFFPKIDIYDATGFGGIVDLLCQSGLIGLIIFAVILKKISSYHNPYLIILFTCIFLCGVQLTFIYPWFLVGINELYIRLRIDNKYETCCRLPLHR